MAKRDADMYTSGGVAHDKQDGDEGPDDNRSKCDASSEQSCTEQVYLFERHSSEPREDCDDEHSGSSVGEVSVQRVTHKHSLFDVLDQEVLKQMTVCLIKLNYVWTQIGTEQTDAQHQMLLMRHKLVETVGGIVDQEEAKYRAHCKKVRLLQARVESMLQDLAVFAPQDQLQQWMRPSDPEHRPGEAHQMGNCLRSQIAYLLKKCQSLGRHRDEHLQKFELLKSQLSDLLPKLGMSLHSFNLQCERIVSQRVATLSELNLLREAINECQAELQRRRVHCRQLSEEVRVMAAVVPLSIEKNEGLVPHSDECFVFSQHAQSQLEELHASALQSADTSWRKLLDMFAQLDQLYRLFEVQQDLRHPFFNSLAPMVNLPESESPWKLVFRDQNVTIAKAKEALQHERDDYQSLKKERMAELVNSIRRQMDTLLAECLVLSKNSLRDDARFWFLFVSAEDCDEQLLSEHERQFQVLQQYQHQYEPILSLVSKWRLHTATLRECDQQLHNCNNYRNRGGILQQLLTQQRQLKKRIQQNVHQIHAWLQEYRERPLLDSSLPFNLYGVQVEHIAKEVGPVIQASKPTVGSSLLASPALFTPASKRSTATFAKQKLFSVSSQSVAKSSQRPRVANLGSAARPVPASASTNRFNTKFK